VGFVGIMLLLGAMGLELAGAEIIFLGTRPSSVGDPRPISWC
jgi:hypothetical protein